MARIDEADVSTGTMFADGLLGDEDDLFVVGSVFRGRRRNSGRRIKIAPTSPKKYFLDDEEELDRDLDERTARLMRALEESPRPRAERSYPNEDHDGQFGGEDD